MSDSPHQFEKILFDLLEIIATNELWNSLALTYYRPDSKDNAKLRELSDS